MVSEWLGPGPGDPLAIWDCNERDGPWSRNRCEASEWAQEHLSTQEHLANRARHTYRAEFYLIDVPFVVLYDYKEDDGGHCYEDPATGSPLREEPYILVLSELPPKHLMGIS